MYIGRGGLKVERDLCERHFFFGGHWEMGIIVGVVDRWERGQGRYGWSTAHTQLYFLPGYFYPVYTVDAVLSPLPAISKHSKKAESKRL